MKKIFILLLVFVLFACSPKGEIKDGTHLDDGVVYVEVMKS